MKRSKRIYRLALVLAAAICQLVVPSGPTGLLVAEEKATARTRPLRIENAAATITEATIGGPRFFAPKSFRGFEELQSPRIKRLREEYQLDEVVGGETNEFRKMLKLRHWVHTRWPINNDQRFSGDAFAILKKAKTGSGFHCSHAMRVQHAAMTAMGFVARDLGVDCNHKEFGRSIHHGVNEVWSNRYAKWVLLDAKYDIHFERDGVPLSALELHEAARADRGKDIAKVQGPDRKVVPMKGLEYPTSSAMGYWWVSYHVAQDRFTGHTRDSRLVIFDNAAFRETTWFRGTPDGLKKHWAYAAKAFIPTADRQRIEWTPGVPDLKIRQVSGAELEVTFRSSTPNLKGYVVRTDGGLWQSVRDGRFRWSLKSGKNTLDVRSQNHFAVNGPIVTATVVFKPAKVSKNASTVPKALAPFFRPPAEFSQDFGDFRSPLKFYDGRPVKTAADWQKRRQEILDRWHKIMKPWPPLIEKPKVEYIKKERRENFTQYRLRIEMAPGLMHPAILLVPDVHSDRIHAVPKRSDKSGHYQQFPAVVVPFYDAETGAGLPRKPNQPRPTKYAFGYELTKRGFVTLSLGFPSSLYYPSKERLKLQPLSALAYVAANCHTTLANLSYVDPQRIGIVGHSYGGKWAMFASCLHDKFACAVWSDGGIVFDEKRANVNYWEPWYLGYALGKKQRPAGIPDKDNPRTGAYKTLVEQGLDLHELHALMSPRPFLVSGGAVDRLERWNPLNHTIAVNKLLGHTDRVAMTNRKHHAPTPESYAQIYAFLEHFLKPHQPLPASKDTVPSLKKKYGVAPK